MKEIAISKLADISTVFNSNKDNVHYYELLKTSGFYRFDNVELARPVIRQSDASIIWKCEANFSFIPFKELSEDKQHELSFQLESFFLSFQNNINNLRNVPPDFSNQLTQIPNLNSIFVNTENSYIVVINWGFLEDSFNRKSDVFQNVFKNKKVSSILVKLINKKRNPVSSLKLKLESDIYREIDITDEKGLARLGRIDKGKEFSVFRILKDEDTKLAEFVCDGRSEYEIIVDQKVVIDFNFRDSAGNNVNTEGYHIRTSQLGRQLLENLNPENSIALEVDIGHIEIFDENDNLVFREEIPDQDQTFEIIIEEAEEIINISLNEPGTENQENQSIKEEANTKIKFINNFNKPIKNMSVNLQDSNKEHQAYTTNNQGEIYPHKQEDNNLLYSFERYNSRWEGRFNLQDADSHVVKVRSIFPWLWWLLLAVLLFLLIYCCFFNCCENQKHSHYNQNANSTVQSQEILPYISDEQEVSCNSRVESGGQGETLTRHSLGTEPGIVTIEYDMQNIPDKLEVFYENKLVASTFDIAHNVNGFVGGSNDAGCCGILSFNYQPSQEGFCVIKVSGPEERTVWTYKLNCPQ